MPDTPVTQESNGINRTATGEIAPPQPPATETTTSTEKSEEGAKTPVSQEKPTDDKAALLNKDAKKEEPKLGAPEKYEDFKPPEGYEIDKDSIAKAVPLFKELGLDQVSAQKMVDLYATLSAQAAEAPVKFWEEKQVEWRSEVIKDREVGNGTDGVKPEVMQTISRAIDTLPGTLGAEFREAMNYTGAGNHLPFVKAMAHWAKLVTEGRPVTAGGPSKFGATAPGQPTRTGAASMYPHLKSASET